MPWSTSMVVWAAALALCCVPEKQANGQLQAQAPLEPSIELTAIGDLALTTAAGRSVLLNGVDPVAGLQQASIEAGRLETKLQNQLDAANAKIQSQANEIAGLKSEAADASAATADVKALLESSTATQDAKLAGLRAQLDALAAATSTLPSCVANMLTEAKADCPAPFITAPTCLPYPELAGGSVSGGGTGVGSVVVLHCDPGSVLSETVANGVIVCTAGAGWSDNATSRCIATTTVTTATATTTTEPFSAINYRDTFAVPQSSSEQPDPRGWSGTGLWLSQVAGPGAGTPTIQYCGPFVTFGGNVGAGTALRKTYDTAKPHQLLRVSLRLLVLDTIDPNEAITVFADGKQIWRATYKDMTGVDDGGANARNGVVGCGRSTLDHVVEGSAFVAHSGESMMLTITSNFNSQPADESWQLLSATVVSLTEAEFTQVGNLQNLGTDTFANSVSGWFGAGVWGTSKANQASLFVDAAAPLCRGECNGTALLGGSECAGKSTEFAKTFHIKSVYTVQRLFVSFTLALIDSWDNEEVALSMNGVEIWRSPKIHHMDNLDSNPTSIKLSTCGSGNWRDQFLDVGPIEVPTESVRIEGTRQKETYATFLFTSTLDTAPADESLGLVSFTLKANEL